MRIALVAVTAVLLASSAQTSIAMAQTSTAPPTGKEVKKDDPNRIVCTRQHVVGSNRPQKVCMTVAERERLKDQSQRLTDESRRVGGSRDNDGNIPGS